MFYFLRINDLLVLLSFFSGQTLRGSEGFSCALVTLSKSGNYRIYISNGQSVVIELSEISKDVEPTTLVDFKSNFCVMKKL